MRQKWLLVFLEIALVVGMIALPPAPVAQAAKAYCRNGDSVGFIYNSQGLHSYVQFNVGLAATKFGYGWDWSPKSVRISGTNVVLNTNLWGVDTRYSYVRIGVQGNGLVLLGPNQFRVCWLQSF